MKEIYAWVPWFQELVNKINEGGEDYLADRAKKVDWTKDNPPLLRFGKKNIDPFSFFYYLAQCNGLNKRKEVYESIDLIFEINRKDLLSTINSSNGFIIPTPTFRSPVLFHNSGEGKPKLLWNLFRSAVKDSPVINLNDFENTLQISRVGVAKLTQCLFLINPNHFMPIDGGIFKFDVALLLPSFKEAQKMVKKSDGFNSYKSFMDRFKFYFPQLTFYEINTVLYLMGSWQNNAMIIGKKFFQINTNILDDGNDQWQEFSDNNYVRTDSKAIGISFDSNEEPQIPYPLDEPAKGDIIFVRSGTGSGRAIGVVHENDYAERGLHKDSAIHVLWLNKQSATLRGQTQQDAFGPVD